MKIPKYIKEHIEANNKLLAQADKHAMTVLKWYDKQLERLNVHASEIPDDLYEIQNNWQSGHIDMLAIKENLELLEQL